MFTGLIQGLGKIINIDKKNNEARFRIEPLFVMENLQNGESIAVNGVCLSVENFSTFKSNSVFTIFASRETLKLTNLPFLNAGSLVNLERAIKMGERIGGHLVSGHVDCLATLNVKKNVGQSVMLRFSFPPQFAPEIITKGSIALNGISLTINNCGRDFLEVNIIPDSQIRTNINDWQVGSKINMETDLIGKYVINAVKFYSGSYKADFSNGQLNSQNNFNKNIDYNFLATNGFI